MSRDMVIIPSACVRCEGTPPVSWFDPSHIAVLLERKFFLCIVVLIAVHILCPLRAGMLNNQKRIDENKNLRPGYLSELPVVFIDI